MPALRQGEHRLEANERVRQVDDDGRTLAILSNRPFISIAFAERASAVGLLTSTYGYAPHAVSVGGGRWEESPTWTLIDVCGDPAAALESATVLADSETLLVLLITCDRAVTPGDFARLLRCRPAGVLGAGMTPEEMVACLDMILGGHLVLHLDRGAEVGALVQECLLRGAHKASGPNLSDEEGTVLRMIATGLSDDEIAGRLFLSEATVRRRMWALRQRTATNGRSELAAWAGAHGYYSGPQA